MSSYNLLTETDKKNNDINIEVEGVNMMWTIDIDNLLAEWCDNAKCYEWMHMRTYDLDNKKSRKFMIITNVLTTLSGLSNVIAGGIVINGFQIAWVFGSISIIVSTLNILQDKLGYSQSAEGHKKLASNWSIIINKITEILILPPVSRKDCKTFLKYIKEDINNALSDQNAIIPEKIRDECSNKFKNIPNFNIPDICGSVEHTVIYTRV